MIGTSTEVTEDDYAIQYIVDGDWGTGFYGSISVTNNTDTVLEDWVLEFDFDREITEIWNGVIEEHEDNHYVVRNAEYNSTIDPGESVSIGIKGCDVEADEQKKMWYDTLVTFISNANKYVKLPYDSVYNINKLISYVNGVTDTSHLKGDFIKRVSELIVEWNKISEDATELRFDVAGLTYVKKYYDSEIVKDIVGSSQDLLDKCSNGISLAVYGADVFDTITYLSQIEANKAVFNENIDALEVLSIWGTDRNIRGAANDVMDILAKEYLQVYTSAISADLIESGADFALYKVASKVGYVAVVVAVRDIMNLLVGSKADVEQMYRILCYSDMCESYSKPLFWILTETDDKNIIIVMIRIRLKRLQDTWKI